MPEVRIDHELILETINIDDQQMLLELMLRIYPPVYQHLWPDNGETYVHSQYNREQLTTELADPQGHYYFITHQQEIVGILRYVLDCPLNQIDKNPTVKLHRIYLDPTLHGKQIGAKVIHWLQESCNNKNYRSIWLECMDTQLVAVNFYKKLGFKVLGHFTLDSPFMLPEYRGMIHMVCDLHS